MEEQPWLLHRRFFNITSYTTELHMPFAKHLHMDKRSRHHVYLGLIDILLAYCYEICVNEGDKNVSLKK